MEPHIYDADKTYVDLRLVEELHDDRTSLAKLRENGLKGEVWAIRNLNKNTKLRDYINSVF